MKNSIGVLAGVVAAVFTVAAYFKPQEDRETKFVYVPRPDTTPIEIKPNRSEMVEESMINLDPKGTTERLFVSARNQSAIVSNTTLVSGRKYILEVSGTFSAGDSITADVDYSITNRILGDNWSDHVSGYEQYGEELLNLIVNGNNVMGSVDWGKLSGSHKYATQIDGRGEPLQFVIKDIYYPNNSGGLNIYIRCKNC